MRWGEGTGGGGGEEYGIGNLETTRGGREPQRRFVFLFSLLFLFRFLVPAAATVTAICTGDPHARNANAMAVTSFTADLGHVHKAYKKLNEALALSHPALYIYIYIYIYI